MKPSEKAILDRIKRIEEAITKGREYLESGAHADWQGFRPLFYAKKRNGKDLPPHKDWVKNVFLPGRERDLREAERLLERLTLVSCHSRNERHGSADAPAFDPDAMVDELGHCNRILWFD